MRTSLLIPLLVLSACLAANAAAVVWAAGVLPARVASHFNAGGAPDGWMSRESHLVLMALVGIGLPLFLAGVFYCVRWLPTSIVNMPHREFWLAPERRLETAASMRQYGLWLAAMESVLLLVIHLLVVEANRVQPVRLSDWVWGALAGFLGALAVWLIALLRRFRRIGGGSMNRAGPSPLAPG
jgi:hypothetical protein